LKTRIQVEKRVVLRPVIFDTTAVVSKQISREVGLQQALMSMSMSSIMIMKKPIVSLARMLPITRSLAEG
jgi:hypothetical protein